MVGVPGRSKGCQTCRRRRIRCDQRRPGCSNCRRLGRPCEGYPDTTFIQVRFVDPAAPDRTETALRHPLPAPSSAPFPSCPSHGRPAPTAAGWDPALAPASTSSESERASIPPSTSLAPATDPETLEYDELLPIQDASALAPATVPAALPLTAFQDAVFITYTRSHLLRGVNDYSTLFQTLSPPSTHPLTCTSLISLSTTYFALSHPSAPSLRLRSHARYATALSAVNAALSAGPSPPIADALTAVVALALHEFLAPTAPAAWLAHCLGLARLFELRGARAVAAQPGLRALFETTRPVVIVAALAARRRCVFADDEWRRVPWEGDGAAPKDRVHLLMDLLVEGPGLLEERAGVERRAGGWEERRRALLRRARELLRALEAWRREWEREYPSTPTEVPPVSEPPVGLDATGAVRPLWTTVWHYGCLYFGNVTALYCATHIFLLAFARSVSEPGACVEGDAGARALYDSATEICRSVDYHLLDCQNGAGSFFLLFPLRMAWQAFGGGASAEAKWVEQVLGNISRGSRGRWLVANHLARPNLTNTGPS